METPASPARRIRRTTLVSPDQPISGPMPFWGEYSQTMDNRQTARVYCEEFHISDAEISILRRPDDKFRLLISSRNKCTTFSQVCKLRQPEDL
jgi:hypothetical protein